MYPLWAASKYPGTHTQHHGYRMKPGIPRKKERNSGQGGRV